MATLEAVQTKTSALIPEGTTDVIPAVKLHVLYCRDDSLTLRLLMSYIYGAPSKARNANVVYIWTYVWQR